MYTTTEHCRSNQRFLRHALARATKCDPQFIHFVKCTICTCGRNIAGRLQHSFPHSDDYTRVRAFKHRNKFIIDSRGNTQFRSYNSKWPACLRYNMDLEKCRKGNGLRNWGSMGGERVCVWVEKNNSKRSKMFCIHSVPRRRWKMPIYTTSRFVYTRWSALLGEQHRSLLEYFHAPRYIHKYYYLVGGAAVAAFT